MKNKDKKGADDSMDASLQYRQYVHLRELQWKTLASYFEAQVDALLASIPAIDMEEADMDDSARLEKSKGTSLDYDHSSPSELPATPKTTPSLTSAEVTRAIHIAGECQRIRMLLSLRKIQDPPDDSLSEDADLYGQLRSYIFELPLASGGALGLCGEKYITRKAIENNYSYLLEQCRQHTKTAALSEETQ